MGLICSYCDQYCTVSNHQPPIVIQRSQLKYRFSPSPSEKPFTRRTSIDILESTSNLSPLLPHNMWHLTFHSQINMMTTINSYILVMDLHYFTNIKLNSIADLEIN